MNKTLATLILIVLVLLVAHDSIFHFDQERVLLKREHQSAQRHWSWFYKQDYVFNDGPFKYQNDIANIAPIVEPNSILLSDTFSSYYLASVLPVYVKNVHIHHNRKSDWRQILDSFYFCYIDQGKALSGVKDFISSQSLFTDSYDKLQFKYWLVNRDPNNLNLRRDCLSARGSEIMGGLENIADMVYEGEYFYLYKINY